MGVWKRAGLKNQHPRELQFSQIPARGQVWYTLTSAQLPGGPKTTHKALLPHLIEGLNENLNPKWSVIIMLQRERWDVAGWGEGGIGGMEKEVASFSQFLM